jgi:hypothetical protein
MSAEIDGEERKEKCFDTSARERESEEERKENRGSGCKWASWVDTRVNKASGAVGQEKNYLQFV